MELYLYFYLIIYYLLLFYIYLCSLSSLILPCQLLPSNLPKTLNNSALEIPWHFLLTFWSNPQPTFASLSTRFVSTHF